MTDEHFNHDGRSYRIESLAFERTGAGVYAGFVSRRDHIASAQAQAERRWGRRPTVVIDPAPGERLSPVTVLLWLKSDTLKPGPDNDGSELVLITFISESMFLETGPRQLAANLITAVRWEAHAREWAF